jgi:hypothetical protein
VYMVLHLAKRGGGGGGGGCCPFACSSNDPFHSFHKKNGMVNLGFFGNPFTWSKRLDRGMASTQWIHLFPFFSLRYLPTYASDHNPILLNTTASNTSLLRTFHFEEFWSKDPSCKEVISNAWNLYCVGSPAFTLTKKLKNTKVALKSWNNLHFGNIQKRIETLSRHLDNI